MSYFYGSEPPTAFTGNNFSSSNPNLGRKITTLEKQGQLVKIAPRIYTPHIEDDPKYIIRRNIFKIIGHQSIRGLF